MTDAPYALLITRPEPGASDFAALCQAQFGADLTVVICPLQRIEYRYLVDVPDAPGGVIFTSANGVRAACESWPHAFGQAFCVGARTAELAAAAGFDAHSAMGDVEDLAAMLIARAPAARLLHLRGAETVGDLAVRLRASGLTCDEIIAYDQLECSPTDEARAALKGDASVLCPVFSPRSARLLLPLLSGARVDVRTVAISPAVSDALGGADAVAETPDVKAVLDAMAGYLGH
ncbi:MAG: uroporphyrinogen-III synthase [Pseudomonadota bacterium]